MIRISSVRPAALALVVVAIMVAGCAGRGVGDVSGQVTYKGKPLTTGSVVFIVADAPPVVARIESDGSYVAKSVPTGDAVITITSLDPAAVAKVKGKGASDRPPEEEKSAAAPRSGAVENKGWFPIPDKYSHRDTSGLKLTVKSGANDFPIQLTD